VVGEGVGGPADARAQARDQTHRQRPGEQHRAPGHRGDQDAQRRTQHGGQHAQHQQRPVRIRRRDAAGPAKTVQ